MPLTEVPLDLDSDNHSKAEFLSSMKVCVLLWEELLMIWDLSRVNLKDLVLTFMDLVLTFMDLVFMVMDLVFMVMDLVFMVMDLVIKPEL
ncbi:MAG: hypothetical protein GY928_10465 [Colwellia sp.]|nr:hypothetical protein [Colwellia sp.]